MVLSEPGAVFAAEFFRHQVSESPDQLVPFGKAILVVEGLHAGEVHEENGRLSAAHHQIFDPRFGKLEKVRHVGQAGQRVIVHLAAHAAFPQHLVERLDQIDATFLPAFGVIALVGIPHIGKPCTRLGIDMAALRVNHGDLIVALRPAVDDVVFSALGGKAQGGVGNAGLVIRMDRTVKVVVHGSIGFLLAVVTEQLAEALRQDQRHDAPVDQLKD